MTSVLDRPRWRRSADPTQSAAAIAGVVVSWITAVLVTDANAGLTTQRLLGVATWAVLVALLVGESPLVRMQTLVVVVFASAVEYTFSPLLEVYVYRFHNVPAYVPPGHGLVYLAALAIGRTVVVRTHTKLCASMALVALGGYALYGLLISERSDVLGAFWYLCLVGFLLWGPSQGLYIGAAVMVTYLEIMGTSLGTWEWQTQDPTGLVSIGNPPSGAAGGYGWFDLAAMLCAPALLAIWCRLRPRSRAGSRPG